MGEKVVVLNEPCVGMWGYYPEGGCPVEDAIWFKTESKRDDSIVENGLVVVG